jgi:hypothetical protein
MKVVDHILIRDMRYIQTSVMHLELNLRLSVHLISKAFHPYFLSIRMVPESS